MKKLESVHEIINGIDPALIEEAADAAAPRRRLPLNRAGLVAACLCAALVGTGAAAVANGWIRVSDIEIFKYYTSDGTRQVSIANVQVTSDGKFYIPLENFCQKSLDFSSSFLGLPQYKGFDSWNGAEEFLELNIADNPVLDQADPIAHSNTSSLGGRTEEGTCLDTDTKVPCVHGWSGYWDGMLQDMWIATRCCSNSGCRYNSNTPEYIKCYR